MYPDLGSTGTCTCPTSVLPPASSTGTCTCPTSVLPPSYYSPTAVVAPHTTVHAVAVRRLLDSSWLHVQQYNHLYSNPIQPTILYSNCMYLKIVLSYYDVELARRIHDSVCSRTICAFDAKNAVALHFGRERKST